MHLQAQHAVLENCLKHMLLGIKKYDWTRVFKCFCIVCKVWFVEGFWMCRNSVEHFCNSWSIQDAHGCKFIDDCLSWITGAYFVKSRKTKAEMRLQGKHVLYSVTMLRNFQRRNHCKEITENRQVIVRPHREVIISVVIGSVGQPSWMAHRWRSSKSHCLAE